MLISENNDKYRDIEKELLSNSNNTDELMEARELFSSLREIRNQQNIYWQSPPAHKINSFKSLILHGLYTAGLLPFPAPAFYLRPEDSLANSNNLLPLGEIYGRPAERMPHLSCETPQTCRQASPDIAGKSASLPITAPGFQAQRVRREAAHPEPLYLPPTLLTNANIRHFLDHHDSSIDAKNLSSIGLINAVVDYVASRRHGRHRLVRAMLASSGFFGAQEVEILSVSVQKKTLRSWMVSLLYPEGIEAHIAAEFISLTACRSPGAPITTSALHQHLFAELRVLPAIDGTPEERLTASAAKYIQDNLIVPLMPVFALDPLPETPPVGSLEWGYLHMGLGFAAGAGLDGPSLTLAQLSALGMSLESMLKEGVVDPELTRLLILPALFFHITSRHARGKTVSISDLLVSGRVKEHVLADFLAESDRMASRMDPAAYYSELLEQYQNRGTLAQEILSEECGLPIPTGKEVLDYYKFHSANVQCSDLDVGDRKNTDRILPDLNALFDGQNSEIADAFAVLDKQMILTVLSQLEQDEYDFLYSAHINNVRASFTHRNKPKSAWGYLALSQYNDLFISQTNDLFMATQDGREIVYALIYQNNAYQLKRLDDKVSSYFELMKNYRPDLENDPNIRLNLDKEQHSWLKLANQQLNVLANALSQAHRQRLYDKLNAIGYEATTAEQIRDLVYSLIPLHDCITHWQNGETQQGVVACATDIVALLPLAGLGVRLGSRIAVKLSFGAGMAVVPAFSGLAMRQSIRAGMQAGLSRLAQYGLKPATRELNRKFLAHTAVEFLRLFDPGFELLGRLGHMTIQQVITVLKILRKEFPAMNELAALLAKGTVGQAASDSGNAFIMARHPVLSRDVPVVRLEGDTYKGKKVYLRVNPETWDAFGVKYTLGEDNALTRIPVPFARRMHNILTQGLGGLGARSQGDSWLTQTIARDRVSHDSFMDVVLYQNKRDDLSPRPGGSLAAGSLALSWQYMYHTAKYKPVQFHISTYGNPDSEHLLFPELRIGLYQDSIDATAYERAFAALTDSEKNAVRTWTLIESNRKSYSDGTPNLTKQFKEPINVEINQKLRDADPLSEEEGEVYRGLMSFLKKDIPHQEGSYLRVAEYFEHHDIPWEGNIAVGDIVTNYPQLMSVSADDIFARLYAEQLAEEGPLREIAGKAMIVYRFDNARKCTPLLPMAASTVIHEVEYLYPPTTFFRVKGISVATTETAFFHPKKRIAVILEELDTVPSTAANLFSGKVYNIRKPDAGTVVAPAGPSRGTV